MNPNPEKAVSQTQPSSGVDHGMANAFEKAGLTPTSFPKEAANDPTIVKKITRGGRGTKAGSELTELIKQTLAENKIKDRQLETELKKDEKLFDKEVERMEDVYAQFSEDLDTLKKRLSEETNGKEKKRLQTLMSQAKDHLRLLRRFFPKDELGAQSEYDTEVFKSVAEKFKKYEEARHRQTVAELNLNDGGGSIGKHEQARNEAIKLREEISSLIQQGESIVAKNSPHPAQNESIGNIRTEGMETISTMPPEINTEERLNIVPNESVSGSVELPQQEEQGGGTEQRVKELEDARINTTVEALTEQSVTNDAQEAVNDFENEGGKVVDADFGHSAEEHDASLPVLTEVVEKTIVTPRAGQEEAFTKFETLTETSKLNLTPEQAKLIKQLEDNIAKANASIEARAEQTGVKKDILHRVGETWNKFPLRYKFLLSAGMLVSGVGAAALGATATMGTIAAIGAGIRGASGAGMFVGFEKILKDSTENKKGAERSKSEELRHTVLAATLSILVAGVLPGIVRDYAVEHGFFDKVREFFGGHTAHVDATSIEPSEIAQGQANLAATEHLNTTNAPAGGGATAEAANFNQFTQTAEAGDSRWSLAERALAEGPYKDQFNAIASDEQRTYIIDALKDKLTVGMTAEQANALNVGDKIDFKEIFADKGFMDKTFSGAQHLSASEIANIQDYGVEVSAETPPRTVSADELLGQPLLTDFTPPEQPTAPIPRVEAGKLADSLISSSVNIPTPEEIIAPPPAVTAETVGLVSLATAATTMPQEFTPKDPQVLAYIDQQFHTDIDTLFGKKGILGIGKMDGMKSVHWLDFENRTFTEIKNAVLPEGPNGVGMNNLDALKKMQSYLLNVSKESKIRPEEGETAGKYIRRAMEMTASRLQTTQ